MIIGKNTIHEKKNNNNNNHATMEKVRMSECQLLHNFFNILLWRSLDLLWRSWLSVLLFLSQKNKLAKFSSKVKC